MRVQRTTQSAIEEERRVEETSLSDAVAEVQRANGSSALQFQLSHCLCSSSIPHMCIVFCLFFVNVCHRCVCVCVCFAIPVCRDPAMSCVVSKHNKEDLSADMTKNVCRNDVHLLGFTNMTIREETHMIALLCAKASLFNPVLHVAHSVQMSAFTGLVSKLVSRRTCTAELSHNERALTWALLIESGHIPLRTMLGTCSRDLYRTFAT